MSVSQSCDPSSDVISIPPLCNTIELNISDIVSNYVEPQDPITATSYFGDDESDDTHLKGMSIDLVDVDMDCTDLEKTVNIDASIYYYSNEDRSEMFKPCLVSQISASFLKARNANGFRHVAVPMAFRSSQGIPKPKIFRKQVMAKPESHILPTQKHIDSTVNKNNPKLPRACTKANPIESPIPKVPPKQYKTVRKTTVVKPVREGCRITSKSDDEGIKPSWNNTPLEPRTPTDDAKSTRGRPPRRKSESTKLTDNVVSEICSKAATKPTDENNVASAKSARKSRKSQRPSRKSISKLFREAESAKCGAEKQPERSQSVPPSKVKIVYPKVKLKAMKKPEENIATSPDERRVKQKRSHSLPPNRPFPSKTKIVYPVVRKRKQPEPRNQVDIEVKMNKSATARRQSSSAQVEFKKVKIKPKVNKSDQIQVKKETTDVKSEIERPPNSTDHLQKLPLTKHQPPKKHPVVKQPSAVTEDSVKKKTLKTALVRNDVVEGNQSKGHSHCHDRPTVPVKETKASKKRNEKIHEVEKAKHQLEVTSEQSYSTPLQRKDMEAKELKQRLHEAYNEIERREKRLEFLTEEHYANLNMICCQRSDTLSECESHYAALQAEVDKLVEDCSTLADRKEHLDNHIKMEVDAHNEKDARHQEIYLEMYSKGKESAFFERQSEIEKLAIEEPNTVTVEELEGKLSNTKHELEKWQAIKLASHYDEAVMPTNEAFTNFEFMKDSMYHYITQTPKESEQHLRAMVSILNYSKVQMKNITKSIEERKKKKKM